MSADLTVRLDTVQLKSDDRTLVVQQSGQDVRIAGVSGPAGPTWAGKFGGFFHSSDQTLAAANTPQLMQLGSSYGASGVELSNSQIVFPTPGTYVLTFVAQLSNLANQVEDAVFWLRLNGSDYANSATRCTCVARKSAGSPSSQLVTITFVGTATAPNDAVAIWWLGTSTDVSLQSDPVTTSPPPPAVPSVIVSVSQVA